MEDALKAEGWYLSTDGIKLCQECCSKPKPSTKDLINEALQLDLRQIGKGVLPESINRGQLSQVTGPMVLQIQKVRNISAPKANEESQVAPRMLRLLLTDGVINCPGVEIEKIPSISLASPPGAKICLKGAVPVQNGFLLLNASSVKFLGGQVEKLKAKWEISKNVSRMQRKVTSDADGPPPFVPFEQRSKSNPAPAPKQEKGYRKENDAPKKSEPFVRAESRGSDNEQRSKGRQSANKRGPPSKAESHVKGPSKYDSREGPDVIGEVDKTAAPDSKRDHSNDQPGKWAQRPSETQRRIEPSDSVETNSRSESFKRGQDSKSRPALNDNRWATPAQKQAVERKGDGKPSQDGRHERTGKPSHSQYEKSRGSFDDRSYDDGYDKYDSYSRRRKEHYANDSNRGPSKRREDVYWDDRHGEKSRAREKSGREDRPRRDVRGDELINNEKARGKGRYEPQEAGTGEGRQSNYSPVPDRYESDDRRGRRGDKGTGKSRDDRRTQDDNKYSRTDERKGKHYQQQHATDARDVDRRRNYDRPGSGRKWENERREGDKGSSRTNFRAEEKENVEETPSSTYNRRIDVRQGSEDSSASGRTSDGTLGSAGDLEPERLPSQDRRRNFDNRHSNRPLFELPPRYENLKNQRKKNIEQLEGAVRVEDLEANEIGDKADTPEPDEAETNYEYTVSADQMQQEPTFVPMYQPPVFMRMNAAPMENHFAPMFMGMNANQPPPYANNFYMAPRIVHEGQYYYAPNQPAFAMNPYVQQPPPPPAPMPGPVTIVQGNPRRPFRRHDVHRPK